jgi:hypothetical protein
METFVWVFMVVYGLQIISGIYLITENRGMELSKSELAWRTIIKFGIFTWAVYLLSR